MWKQDQKCIAGCKVYPDEFVVPSVGESILDTKTDLHEISNTDAQYCNSYLFLFVMVASMNVFTIIKTNNFGSMEEYSKTTFVIKKWKDCEKKLNICFFLKKQKTLIG